MTVKFLPALLFQYMYDFLEAVITRQTSPEEAYRKLDEMATKQTETLRKLTKQVGSSWFLVLSLSAKNDNWSVTKL